MSQEPEAVETVTISRQSLQILLELAAQAPIQGQAQQIAQMAAMIQPALEEAQSVLASA